jgi:CHAT domain-containing protein/tetratricopeptide (TPR) repeat protein
LTCEGPADDSIALAAFEQGQRLLWGRPAQPDAAIGPLETARERWSPDEHPQHWAAATAELASAYLARRDGGRRANYDRAITLFEEAVATLAERAPDDPNLPHVLYVLAVATSERGGPGQEDDIVHAIELLELGLTIARERGDAAAQAEILMGAAGALGSRLADGRVENQERAIEVLIEAMKVAKNAGAANIIAVAHHQLGNLYAQRARGSPIVNLALAIDHFENALEALDPATAPQDAARTIASLAQAHSRQGGPRHADEAVRLSRQAVALAEASGTDHDRVVAVNALADALASASPPDRDTLWSEAEDTYRTALTLAGTADADPGSRAIVQKGFAYELLRRGDQDEGRLVEGIELLGAAITTFTELGDDDHLLMALTDLGFAQQQRSRWSDARLAFDEALTVGRRLVLAAWTDVGRRSETATISRVAPESAYCSVLLGEPVRALATLEAGRATLLGALLRLDDVRREDLPEPLRSKLNTCQAEVDRLELSAVALTDGPEPFAHMRELLAAQRALAAVRTEVADVVPRVLQQGLTPTELLAEAPEGGALVIPLATRMGGACFVVPNGRTTVTTDDVLMLPELTASEVTAMWTGDRTRIGWSQAYRNAVAIQSSPNQDEWHGVVAASLERLRTLLMGPVDIYLRDLNLAPGADLVVLPQGGLGVFPLHAATELTPHGACTFLDRWTVRYSPSGDVLRSTKRRPAGQTRRLLAIADPTFELPAASAEVEAVETHFAPTERTVLSGAAATRAAVLTDLIGRSHVHIASHATYGWDDPSRSRLALYGSDSLKLGEVTAAVNLRDTRLVVLSACETGITEVEMSPDEFIGLAGAFLAAGAQAVLSTLWAVHDLPTALLVARFYDLHLGAGATPAVALAEAQRWLRDATVAELLRVGPWSRDHLPTGRAEDMWRSLVAFGDVEPSSKPFAHPVFWAAFTVTGT